MARAPSAQSPDFSDKPLADYFWIAGLDSNDLLEAYRTRIEKPDSTPLDGPLNLGITETIVEDALAEEKAGSILDSPVASANHSRQSSYQKLGRLSVEARSSIRSIDKLSYRPSVRSNGTIRAVVGDGANRSSPVPLSAGLQDGFTNGFKNHAAGIDSRGISDEDFEDVMKRFTYDRDAFYLDLNFKSDATDSQPSRTKSKLQPRTQRIMAEELDSNTLPGRAIGSVRRHMSIREMNSTKRQPSVARHMSTRTARRMSSYNSVMPRPQPLAITPDEHPLKRTFEPALLDRYPRPSQTTELRRRERFPAFVPMFAFPNDINIVPSDARPPSTWHELQFTNDDNVKAHAVCVIIWISLDRKTADDLEKRCEEWRKAHMSEAERELAASLGERLAAERAKLSRLLLSLPSAESGSSTREQLEEQIGKVEDKIALMSDMLKPLRHGAASRIEGLTHGDTGLWIPRAYGILGPDQAMVCFWKEWLKAVVVPMMDGSVLHVPASSPRIGVWQPLERYVHALCIRALRPLTSRVQVEVAVRDIKLYAKREAKNELPGTRTCDLYPLFRALTIPNIMALFEYVLTEQRIIFVSSHTAMLKLASSAIMSLIWPLTWQGVHIPVVPSRLMEVVDAPVPYIIGIVRTSEKLPLPDQDDFVMVDLDKNEIHATEQPIPLPKQQRRKLMSLLYLAAPHHTSRGLSEGVPRYAMNTFATDMFASENIAVLEPIMPSAALERLASVSSTYFGSAAASDIVKRAPILNAYLQARPTTTGGMERPGTALTTTTARRPSRTGSEVHSPVTTRFNQQPTTPQSKNDSGFALQTSLREKRSGQFDSWSRRTPSISNVRRKASLPFVKHNATLSSTSDATSFRGTSTYAPSTYAQSTLAASTVLPGIPQQHVRNTDGMTWLEGHCMQLQGSSMSPACSVCHEKAEESHYRCIDCPLVTHDRCLEHICIPCQSAFYPNQIRAAFARFFASLFYNYRRFMRPPDATQRKQGIISRFDVDAWTRSVPSEHAEYLNVLKQTQAFDQFVVERETETISQSSNVALFDAILAAKKNRSKGVRSSIAVSLSGRNPFAGRSHSGGVPTDYLSDTSMHTWRVVSTPHSSDRPDLGSAARGRDYRSIVSRAPARLEDDLFPPVTTPKAGSVPAVPPLPVPKRTGPRHRMNGLSMHAP